MPHRALRKVIDAVLGPPDGDAVTRRIRLAVVRSRAQGTPRPPAGLIPELIASLAGRRRPEMVIRDLGARTRRR